MSVPTKPALRANCAALSAAFLASSFGTLKDPFAGQAGFFRTPKSGASDWLAV